VTAWTERPGGRGWEGTAGLIAWWALLAPALALAGTPVPEEPVEPVSTESDWIDEQRRSVEQGLGALVGRFDQFFGDDQKLDVETHGSRFRVITWARTSRERPFAMGATAGATLDLPRLERWLGNARLVLVGLASAEDPAAPAASRDLAGGDTAAIPGSPMDPGSPFLSRGRGRAELRFDLLRRRRLILDSGAGVRLEWPPVPFARVRAHVRLELGAGILLRGTESLFLELGGRGAGTSADLELGRLLTPELRVRWEGHAILAERTRGLEWATLVGGDWKVHPRTGLYSTAGCSGFERPVAQVELWRVAAGVRQDIWGGWVFTGLEPELTWPRLPGQPRRQLWAVTLRLEVLFDTASRIAGSPP
jgi:hypothetical protein